MRFCLCWIAPTWIVFELVATKLPHYVLPTYPAIACLAAAALLAPDGESAGRWAVYRCGRCRALWLLVGVALAVLAAGRRLGAGSARRSGRRADRARRRAAAGRDAAVAPDAAGGCAAVACAAGAALILFASAYAYQLPRLRTIWISPRIAEAVARARPCADDDRRQHRPYTEPSLVFLLGTGTKLTDVAGRGGAPAARPGLRASPWSAPISATRFSALLKDAKFAPVELDRISGLNYSTGKRLDLILYGAPRAG